MISDKYIALTRRVVTLTPGTDGGTTESTTDSTIYGAIFEMSGSERFRNNQLGVEAVATLYTDSDLALTDRVLDGTTEYEIVWKYSNRYDLKRSK